MTPTYIGASMVKVTRYENLVPSRDPWVKGTPHSDLIHNVLLARKLIRAAAFIFQLKKGAAIYSGYINEHAEGSFTYRVRERGVPIRTLVLNCLGYAGELTVDVEDMSQAVSFDVLGSLAANPAVHLAVSD
jgi:hypothetical protein